MNTDSFRLPMLRWPIRSFVAIASIQASIALGQSTRYATIPGKLATPFPTLQHLAVEWEIEGDDNENGIVKVRYRRAKTADWEEGLSLRRIPAQTWREDHKEGRISQYHWSNKHSGSLFDLQPDTEYEIELDLIDPDGGSTKRSIVARTRAVPRAMPEAPIKRASPMTLDKIAANAQPGDILLLEPGAYGYFEVPCSGELDKPIVFRADPDGVFPGSSPPRRGEPLFEGISLQNRRYVHLEGLVSFGTIDLFYAEDCAITRCRVSAIFGIISGYTGNLRKWAPGVAQRLTNATSPSRPHSKNCYIADNVVNGLTPWKPDTLGYLGKNMGEGIEITGPGNVICYNRVTGFRDCISTLEDNHQVNQVCIDIYNNDIDTGSDDGIEADFSMGNCRILRNRITNCAIGLSSQPSLGGPTYFIRNAMYNITNRAYKPSRGSVGDVVMHNTVVKYGDGASGGILKVWSRAWYRNNLSIGGGSKRRYDSIASGPILAVNFPNADPTCDFDYNGYGTIDGSLRGDIGGQIFRNREQLRDSREPHSVQVDLTSFASVVEFPDPQFPRRLPVDLRLSSNSPAVDAAQPLPNINDGFTGRAPDIGAYEYGQALPIYGPRPKEWNP